MKTWFITGASRGFGALVTELALSRGHNVVATARNPEAVTDRFGKLSNLRAVGLDVTDDAQAQLTAKAAVDAFGRIDVLLNNAGFGLVGAVEEASAGEVEKLYATNVFGLLNVTRAVLPTMRSQRAGLVLNISSIGGYRSSPGFGIYCSTKFAVEGISEALHGELEPLGIGVTVIEPGYFRTDFLDSTSLAMSATEITDYEATSGAVRHRATQINGNQPGNPKMLAQVLVDLADEPNPPVRLPLGSDTVAAIHAKHQADATILTKWHSVAVSTDFPAE